MGCCLSEEIFLRFGVSEGGQHLPVGVDADPLALDLWDHRSFRIYLGLYS